MDPNKTLSLLNACLQGEAFIVAEEHAEDLLLWLNRGGFPPSGKILLPEGAIPASLVSLGNTINSELSGKF